ncbi:MAG TPA: hypothetical protein VLX92_16645, partial [Kofleriaceae bacterium]|nr:hypothetical protein [Kofleriaceae bacterium]
MTARGRRPPRRDSGDNAFQLARGIVLAPIVSGAPGAAAELIEPAWDGHRVLATRVGDDVRLAAADFREWTHTFPAIARALGKLAAPRLAIDGVVCVLDGRGVPSFDRLRDAVARGPVGGAVLICWDLLHHGDDDLRSHPLAERRRRLAALLAGAPPGLVPSQALPGALPDVLAAAAPLGLRGVVVRAAAGDHAAPWCAVPAAGHAIDWQRSLSPPPPLSNADKVLYP